MKVYLASWFASINETKKKADELRAVGIEVTSRWLEETIKPTTQIQDVELDYLRETAKVDLHDILIADTVVLNVPSFEELKDPTIPLSAWARGGRHFEAGFQYATMVFFYNLPSHIFDKGTRRLILVGRRENVFHYLDSLSRNGRAFDMMLPEIPCFDTWEEAKNYLVEIAEKEPKPIESVV